ncbi:MAG: hypothetical protein IJ458_01400 [Clostridia bacterium]|nr:hypothetical protein [Clostridia bacterium]
MSNVRVKERKRIKGSTVAIIVLSVMLVASIAVGVTLAYFAADANVVGNVTLGDPVNINITQGGSTVTSLTFSDDALPGHVYDQVIGVSIPADTSDALLRAKLTISNTDGATLNVEATTVDAWVEGDDGYYYYNGVASAGDAIDFVTAVTIPTGLTNVDANKTFNIDISVEAIQEANNAARAVWTTAPEEWLDTYNPVADEGGEETT